ncbi:MAG TPA: hypothetical protein VHK90_17785, partial [Thermoanaerobaculia bacterium]|nr:hypothetical protein [Thermoanaerobaculia bacterium]
MSVVPAVPEEILGTSETLLRDLCAISSESGNANGIRAVAQKLVTALTPNRLAVEIFEEHDANGVPQPVLVARGPSNGGRHLLL